MASQGASPPAAAACHMSPPPPRLCSKPHHPARPAAATFCFPSKGSLQLGAMSFRLSLHHLFSPLLRRLCSCLLPSLPVPLPRACSHSPVGCAGRGLGPPKSGSAPGLGCSARPWVPLPHGHLHSMHQQLPQGWFRSTESCVPAPAMELSASVVTAPRSASLLGLRAHAKLVWGTSVAPSGTTTLAMEVAACPHQRGRARAVAGSRILPQ